MSDDVKDPRVEAWVDRQMRAIVTAAILRRAAEDRMLGQLDWLRASLRADGAPAWLVDMVIAHWDYFDPSRED